MATWLLLTGLPPPSWFGPKPPPEFFVGRDLGRNPSPRPPENPSTATGTPCTHSHRTGWTQRLWTWAAPARRDVPSSASPEVATHPLTDGLH